MTALKIDFIIFSDDYINMSNNGLSWQRTTGQTVVRKLAFFCASWVLWVLLSVSLLRPVTHWLLMAGNGFKFTERADQYLLFCLEFCPASRVTGRERLISNRHFPFLWFDDIIMKYIRTFSQEFQCRVPSECLLWQLKWDLIVYYQAFKLINGSF